MQKIREAILMAERLRHVFVATADKKGLPHVAAAEKIALTVGGLLSVTSWFCPGTVANLTANKLISVVVWDSKADKGYQLLGELVEMQDTAVLDGYSPETGEEEKPLPQFERKLLVKISKVLEFKHAPHSDIEE